MEMNEIMIEIRNASEIVDNLHRKGMELWDDLDEISSLGLQFCEIDKEQIFSDISKLRTKLDMIEDAIEHVGEIRQIKGV